MSQSYPVHSRGSQARILLTSVFGPYAQDDEYGSRRMNPMELYHNQVTREQGPPTISLARMKLPADRSCRLSTWPVMFTKTAGSLRM